MPFEVFYPLCLVPYNAKGSYVNTRLCTLCLAQSPESQKHPDRRVHGLTGSDEAIHTCNPPDLQLSARAGSMKSIAQTR